MKFMQYVLGIALVGFVTSACEVIRRGEKRDDAVIPHYSQGIAKGWGAYRQSPGLAALPKAQIYRTSCDVDAHVPVTVNPVDGTLVSFPAPQDISGASMPAVLADGWLLDRRGISPDTRFLRYTYSRYSSLLEPPAPRQLLDSVIPGARVTEIVQLPYAVSTVSPARADSLIKAGLPGCETVYRLPQRQ